LVKDCISSSIDSQS